MAEQEILRILECPCCFEFMFSPIYMCTAGHSICKNCRLKVRNCPSCRSSVNTRRRNYSLEKVASIITYPCPHSENGCTESLQYDNIKTHTQTCGFRPYNCILDADTLPKCNFQGPREKLKKHFQEKHQQPCWEGISITDLWAPSNTFRKVQVIFCYGEMFYFHKRLIEKRNIYWACQFIGKSEEAANYTYTITIKSADGRECLYRDRCHPDLISMESIITTGRCFTVSVPTFETFMDTKKEVCTYVTIEKVPQEILVNVTI